MRWLIMQLLTLERHYLARIKRSDWLGYLTHSYLFSFKTQPLARGLAIGMFWMLMPIPLQMLPATLFCWLGFANLPVALLAVWVSNPFTYLPIFYIEYKVGLLLFHADEDIGEISFAEFAERYEQTASTLGNIYLIVLEGALVLGVAAAIIGYFIGLPLSFYLQRFSKRLRR